MKIALRFLSAPLLAIAAAAAPQIEAKQPRPQENKKEIALACSLDALSTSEREQHRDLTKQMREAIREIKELPQGFAFRFEGDSEQVVALARWVAFERLCCPFFSFQMEVGSKDEPLWLKITGRNGAKEFMRAAFNLK
jgi:hypothetical protein